MAKPAKMHAADLADGGQGQDAEQGPAPEDAEGPTAVRAPKADPTKTDQGSWYRAARLAVRIWVRSPSSATTMTAKAASATR